MRPVIDGWIAQWYVNVPGASKRVVDDAPSTSGPELHAPVSDVHVCVALSRLVTVTDEPRRTSSGFGENAKPAIVSAAFDGEVGTVVVAGGAVMGGAAVAGGAVVGGTVGDGVTRTAVGVVADRVEVDAAVVGGDVVDGAAALTGGVDVVRPAIAVVEDGDVTVAAAGPEAALRSSRAPPPLPHPAAASPSATTITSPVRTSDIRPDAPAGSPPTAE